MKKIVSLLLIISVICSLAVSSLAAWHLHNDFCDICGGCKVEGCTDYDNCTCSAANDWEQGTEITLTGQYAQSEYTVTVPAKLAPGESGEVVVNGAWNSQQRLTVSCPNKVVLTYNGQSMDVSINFDGISQIGSDIDYMNASEQITVGDATAIFGTWTGRLDYDVELKVTNLSGTTWQLNEEIQDYDWMTNDLADGICFTLQNDSVEENNACCLVNYDGSLGVWAYSPDSDMTFMYTTPETAESYGMPDYAGWSVANYTLADSVFTMGDFSKLDEYLATVQKTNAPQIIFDNSNSSLLTNEQFVDWIYDNATRVA